MAFKVEKITAPKKAPHWFAGKSYICDTPDDINNLPKFNVKGNQQLNDGEDAETNEPCYYGSSATVAEPFSGYTLNASNEWKKIFPKEVS